MYSSIVKKIHRHPLSLPERTHVHDIFNVLYDDLHNGLFDELQAGLYDGPLIPLYEGLYFDLVTASTTASMEGGGGQEIVENNEASDQVNRPRNFKEVSGTARKNFKKSQNYCV